MALGRHALDANQVLAISDAWLVSNKYIKNQVRLRRMVQGLIHGGWWTVDAWTIGRATVRKKVEKALNGNEDSTTRIHL